MTPETRRIWLCADDYGIAPGVDAAIRDLVARGRLNATSVMVVAPSFNHASAQALARLNDPDPRVAIGLHLTLTAPFEPLSAAFEPLAGGRFLPVGGMMRYALTRRILRPAVAAEVTAQIGAFVAAFGRVPDFIDGHQHVHVLPGVREALLSIVREKAPRAWLRQCGRARPWAPGDLKAHVLDAFSRGFRKGAARHGLRTNTAFAGTYAFRDGADIGRLFPTFLAGLPNDGLVMCHPGFVDAELLRLDPLTTLREREYAFFSGPDFPRQLASAGVVLR